MLANHVDEPLILSIPSDSGDAHRHDGTRASTTSSRGNSFARSNKQRSNTLDRVLATQLPLELQGKTAGEAAQLATRRNVNTPLSYLYRFFKSLPVQILMILVTFLDISFLLYEFISGEVTYSVVTLCTSLMFMLELMILLGHDGAKHFSTSDKKWMIAEVVIVTISFVVEYTEYIIEAEVTGEDTTGKLRYLRAIRFLRVLIIWKTRYRYFTEALRRLVSADRRRYQRDGYDLDLTYVHPKVIAMSWPSSSTESMYRNQIDTVAQFLDDKHKDHYRVYNLCSERAYDESKFHLQTRRFRMDDHSPAELPVMLAFARDVHSFIAENPRLNVAVIHCKGGKGRTGTMVCTYLIYSGIKKTADAALNHFGLIRTSDDATSFQGVESPAQDRYVRYFQRLLLMPRQEPPPRRVKFTSFVLHDVPFAWWSSGADKLWFAVITKFCTERQLVYLSNPEVTFDPHLPLDPFQKRKIALSSARGTRAASTSPRLAAEGGEDPMPENVYSDDDAPTGTPRLPVQDKDTTGAEGSRYFGGDAAADECAAHASNMAFFVNRDMEHPMDFAEFHSTYVSATGNASPRSGLTSARFGINATSSSTSHSNFHLTAANAAPRRGIDKSLRVSIAFDVSEMPAVEGDINIRFFFNQDNPNTLYSPLQTFFNPSFEGNAMSLAKAQLDGPHKEAHKDKKFPKHIELCITWETVDNAATSGQSSPSEDTAATAAPQETVVPIRDE